MALTSIASSNKTPAAVAESSALPESNEKYSFDVGVKTFASCRLALQVYSKNVRGMHQMVKSETFSKPTQFNIVAPASTTMIVFEVHTNNAKRLESVTCFAPFSKSITFGVEGHGEALGRIVDVNSLDATQNRKIEIPEKEVASAIEAVKKDRLEEKGATECSWEKDIMIPTNSTRGRGYLTFTAAQAEKLLGASFSGGDTVQFCGKVEDLKNPKKLKAAVEALGLWRETLKQESIFRELGIRAWTSGPFADE